MPECCEEVAALAAGWLRISNPPEDAIMAYISINRVAARYDTSKHTVYRWLRDGSDFPQPVRLPSGPLRWAVSDLEAWEESHRTATAA
jgi:predicted DNA-binding transcriptional regulator AlpA